MKLFKIFICVGGLIFTNFSFSQSTLQHTSNIESKSGTDISELTQLMLQKNYSATEIQEMKQSYLQKLASLDYYYSKSFKVKAGQSFTNQKFLAIDITQLDQYRLMDQTTEVVDTASHLHLILDSQNTVATTRQNLLYPNGTPDYTQKYQHQ